MTSLLDRFSGALGPENSHILADVRDYIEWQGSRRAGEFIPSVDDDVALRTWLLHLRTANAGVDQMTLQMQVSSLKRFYKWAEAEGLVDSTPFARFNFDRPFLSRDQIRRRQDTLVADPREREIARLRALNHIAGHLNQSPDVQTALDVTLETLVKLMDLKTAWVSLWIESSSSSPLGFRLAAAYGLPPGLEQDNCYYLRRPPACHCQHLLRAGKLKHAVNVVECTRLQDLTRAGGDTGELLFHATVPLISQEQPLGILNVATSEWQFLSAADLQLLSAVGAQVATAIERARLYELAHAQRTRLEAELEMARVVQAGLLPSVLPDIPGFSLAADWRSAREVAGDFYDIFALPDGLWGIVIADVSDKGAPAALYMAMVRSLIRATSEHTPSPAAVLVRVNQVLCSQSSADMFVTVFYAVLDPLARTLTYANAGHNPPIIRRASGPGGIEHLPFGGLLIGMLDEVSLADTTLGLEPGDALVAYTDGLTDAENSEHQDYGLTHLDAAIAAAPATAPALLAHVLADQAAFTGNAPLPDDITLFVVTCGTWPDGY